MCIISGQGRKSGVARATEATPVPLFYNPYVESKAKSEDVIDWEDWNR